MKLIDRKEIAKNIEALAGQVSAPVTLIAILKGALCFAADLIRHLPPSTEIDFIRCRSYVGEQRGSLTIEGVDALAIEGRHVLVLDDIFDSGATLSAVVDSLLEKKPHSLKSAVIVMKEGVRRVTNYRPDYVLFDIPNHFVIGYGLDDNEACRGLPDIGTL